MLSAAAGFASWPVVETLLAMGADPTVTATNGLDPLMTMTWAHRHPENITRWCEKFPTWNFSRRAGSAGATVATFALMSGPDSMATVDALVKGGVDPLAFTAHSGTTLLHNAAANKDADGELVRYLLRVPGVKALVDTPQRGQTFKWRAQFVVVRLLVRLGNTKALLQAVSEWPKMTPLMTAARNGNAAVIKVLVEEGGADFTLRNARGKTALDLLVGGENALEESRRLLGGGAAATGVE